MQSCTSLDDGCIHSENTIIERRQYMFFHPRTKQRPLQAIAALDQEDSDLEFQNRDGR